MAHNENENQLGPALRQPCAPCGDTSVGPVGHKSGLSAVSGGQAPGSQRRQVQVGRAGLGRAVLQARSGTGLQGATAPFFSAV